jgi:hypothetical protein
MNYYQGGVCAHGCNFQTFIEPLVSSSTRMCSSGAPFLVTLCKALLAMAWILSSFSSRFDLASYSWMEEGTSTPCFSICEFAVCISRVTIYLISPEQYMYLCFRNLFTMVSEVECTTDIVLQATVFDSKDIRHLKGASVGLFSFCEVYTVHVPLMPPMYLCSRSSLNISTCHLLRLLFSFHSCCECFQTLVLFWESWWQLQFRLPSVSVALISHLHLERRCLIPCVASELRSRMLLVK